MAKYLDSNGLSHFMTILKGLRHSHSIGNPTKGSAASVTAGTAASLSTENKTFVTEASKVTTGTPISVPNISVEAAATDTVKGVNVFTPNTPTSVTKKTVVLSHTPMSAVVAANSCLLEITKDSSSSGDSVSVTAGTAASLTTTNKTFTTDATKASAGNAISVPNLSAAAAPTDTVKGVDTFTPNTPTAVSPNTVVTGIPSSTGQSGIA